MNRMQCHEKLNRTSFHLSSRTHNVTCHQTFVNKCDLVNPFYIDPSVQNSSEM